MGCCESLFENMMHSLDRVLNESFPVEVLRPHLSFLGNFITSTLQSVLRTLHCGPPHRKNLFIKSHILKKKKVTYFVDPFNSSISIFGCVAQKSTFETNTLGYIPKKFKN